MMMRCFVIFLAICAFANALRCEDTSLVHNTHTIIGVNDDELVLRNCIIENVTFVTVNATIEMYDSVAVVTKPLIIGYATRVAIFDGSTFKVSADFYQNCDFGALYHRLANNYLYGGLIDVIPDWSPALEHVVFTNNHIIVE